MADTYTQLYIQINSMPDHIHILVGITPDIAISDLVRDIKANSSKFINKQRWIEGWFEWQTGFAAFSYAHSQLNTVARYIKNQEEHHSRQTFREEYLAFLERFDVPYNPKYVFDADDVTEEWYTYRPAGAFCPSNRGAWRLHRPHGKREKNTPDCNSIDLDAD